MPLQRKFKALWKGRDILPYKFDVSAITSFATIGTELRVHWNRENNSITLKKFGKNIHDDDF